MPTRTARRSYRQHVASRTNLAAQRLPLASAEQRARAKELPRLGSGTNYAASSSPLLSNMSNKQEG